MRQRVDSSIVRDYTAADSCAVLQLWCTVFRQSFPYLEDCPTDEEFRLYFETVLTRQQRIWIAVEGEKIIGFVSFTSDAIRNLFVDCSNQGMGTGTALLERALLEEPDIHIASTLAANQVARRFYEKNGFTLSHLEPHTFVGQQAAIYGRTNTTVSSISLF